jgi:DNA-binding response OmpR family regulator
MATKVMVIDDEPEIINLIKFALEREGYEVAACDNGGQAWDAISRFRPDLLLLDIMLPGVDGYSLQIKLAQEPTTKDIPIIVITSLHPVDTLFDKFPQVASFMIKPLQVEELLSNVRFALTPGSRTDIRRPPKRSGWDSPRQGHA